MIETGMGGLGCFSQREFFQRCSVKYDYYLNFISFDHIYDSPKDPYEPCLYCDLEYKRFSYLVDEENKIIKNIHKLPDDNDDFCHHTYILPTAQQIVNFQGYKAY